MGCFLTDRRNSIRAIIFACLYRTGGVEKPRQSPAMPAFFSLPVRQIRRKSDCVIEFLRSLRYEGAYALHRVPYRTMPYAEARKSMDVDGISSYKLRGTVAQTGKSGANLIASLSFCNPSVNNSLLHSLDRWGIWAYTIFRFRCRYIAKGRYKWIRSS